tara:strand:+ start:1280 stop:2476 length:1197 start_codon:yes stop_codon:yes gene_type:complete
MAGLLKVNRDEVKKVVGSILGGEEEKELDLKKSYLKFNEMSDHIIRYTKIMTMLYKSTIFTKFPNEKAILESYIETVSKAHQEFFGNPPPASRLMDMHPLIPKSEEPKVLAFLKYYNKAKKAQILHSIMNTLGKLVDYKSSIGDIDNLSDTFFAKSSMLTFQPIEDLPLNFKLIYISDIITDDERKLLLLSIHKIYTVSMDLYKSYSKVDIDTENFVKAVRITVEKLKKQIPRCNEAFQKILDSTDLLKDNYEDYYKDYVGSQNSMIIAENFIQDVAGTVDKSPRLALQFRKIIQHLRNMTNRLIAQDPKYKDTFGTLLDQADNSFNEIKKNMKEEGVDLEAEAEAEGEDDLDLGLEGLTPEALMSMVGEIREDIQKETVADALVAKEKEATTNIVDN